MYIKFAVFAATVGLCSLYAKCLFNKRLIAIHQQL